MTKPNLYFFGDSFVRWPKPDLHWTLRFEDEYKVHRLGRNGANLEYTALQLGRLPKYEKGDRVVFVLTEYLRNPKWIWGDHYLEFCNQMQAVRSGKERTTTSYVQSLLEVINLRDEWLDKTDPYFTEITDNPKQIIEFFENVNNIIPQFKPVLVTWNHYTKELIPSCTLIAPGTYEPLAEDDYHPGEEGGLVWYNKVKELLDGKKPLI